VLVVNYGRGSNPVDSDVYLAHAKCLRKMVNTITLQGYDDMEVPPGAAVQTDAQFLDYVRRGLALSLCIRAARPRCFRGTREGLWMLS
jgi:hypothetical protein